MQCGIDDLILIHGEDKTDSIVSYNLRDGKCDIVYKSGDRVYSYKSANVRILKLICPVHLLISATSSRKLLNELKAFVS